MGVTEQRIWANDYCWCYWTFGEVMCLH